MGLWSKTHNGKGWSENQKSKHASQSAHPHESSAGASHVDHSGSSAWSSYVKAVPMKLPRHWKAAMDEKVGKIYYYNTQTRQTTWQKPGSDAPQQGKPQPQVSGVDGDGVLDNLPNDATNSDPLFNLKPDTGDGWLGRLDQQQKAKEARASHAKVRRQPAAQASSPQKLSPWAERIVSAVQK